MKVLRTLISQISLSNSIAAKALRTVIVRVGLQRSLVTWLSRLGINLLVEDASVPSWVEKRGLPVSNFFGDYSWHESLARLRSSEKADEPGPEDSVLVPHKLNEDINAVKIAILIPVLGSSGFLRQVLQRISRMPGAEDISLVFVLEDLHSKQISEIDSFAESNPSFNISVSRTEPTFVGTLKAMDDLKKFDFLTVWNMCETRSVSTINHLIDTARQYSWGDLLYWDSYVSLDRSANWSEIANIGSRTNIPRIDLAYLFSGARLPATVFLISISSIEEFISLSPSPSNGSFEEFLMFCSLNNHVFLKVGSECHSLLLSDNLGPQTFPQNERIDYRSLTKTYKKVAEERHTKEFGHKQFLPNQLELLKKIKRIRGQIK